MPRVKGKETRRRRWLRWVLVALAVLVAAWWIVTSSPLTKRLILPRLAAASGMDVRADRVWIDTAGNIVLRDAEFFIPGQSGPSARLARVARATASVSWTDALAGGQPVRSLELIDPVVTLSQTTDGTLNIAPLLARITATSTPQPVPQPAPQPPPQPSTLAALQLPEITLINAAVELAEHTATTTTVLKRLPLDGRLTPTATPGVYTLALREASTRTTPLRIDGTIDHADAEITLTNLSLDDWPDSSLPTAVRAVAADLAPAGTVPSARVSYTQANGFTAELTLKDVALNLPLQPDPTFITSTGPVVGPPTRLIRMRDVQGKIALNRPNPDSAAPTPRITANLSGLVEDLPYRVDLDYQGLTLDAPFTLAFAADKFQLERNPALLPYAPPKVREFLTMFSSPTALLTAAATITRPPPAAPDIPADIAVQGVVDLESGVAAYENFPYQFSNISARFLFDENSFRIENMRGSTADGATLAATAHVAPLDDSAEVRVKVQCTNVPIDATLERAFGPARAGFIQTLFSTSAYQDLLDRSLVKRPGSAAADAPTFELGGRARVDIDIYTPPGTDAPWTVNVDVEIPSAGLVPAPFPYPINATDVRVEVRNENGRLVAGRFEGIDGGTATVDATFTVPKLADPDGRSNPVVNIRATNLPASPRTIHAIPDSSNPSRLKDILRYLAIDAKLSGEVRVANRPATGEPGVDARLDFTNATVSPEGFGRAPRAMATAATGSITATESTVDLTLTALLRGPAAQTVEELPATQGPQRSPISLTLRYAKIDARPTLALRGTIPALDLAIPLESIVWPFSTKAADQIANLALEHTPRGSVALDLTLDQIENPIVTTTITPKDTVTFNAKGQPVRLDFPAAPGSIRLRAADTTTLSFNDLRADLAPAGSLRITGDYALDPTPPTTAAAPLVIALNQMPIESPLVTKALAAGLSASALERLQSLQPRGLFDADFTITPPQTLTGSIKPKSLALTLPTDAGPQPLAFNTITGSIDIEPGGGVLRRLTAQAPQWSITLDGSWSLPATPNDPFTITGNASARADAYTQDLAAALPADVRNALSTIGFKVQGPIELADATVEFTQGPGPAQGSTSIDGTLRLARASLDAGLAITDLDTVAALQVRAPRDGPPTVSMPIRATALRAGGITITDAAALLSVNDTLVTVEDIRAACHGGRLAGHAAVFPDESTDRQPNTPTPRRYTADLRLAGARFKPLLDELNPPTKAPPADLPSAAPITATAQDLTRGIADAGVFLTGIVADPASRRGRGEITVARRGSRILDLPLALRLIEVSNLQLPLGSSLDFARAKFYLDGPTVAFDELTATSSSVTLSGYGTLNIPTQALDLRFNSTSARPIPVVNWLLEGVRNELVTTEVKGTLDNPTFGIIQLPTARRAITRTVGLPISDQSKLLADIQRRAESLRSEDARARWRIPAAQATEP